MNKKKIIIVLLAIVCILSIGLVFYNSFLNKKASKKEMNKGTGKVSTEQEKPDLDKVASMKNKYYSVYIKYDSGQGSSFVPKSLNPDLDYSDDYNVIISTDDNGNVINNDGKIIVIDNLVISDENKEKIKKIAGSKYDEAIEEIQEEIDNLKNELKEKGILK